MKRWKRTIDHIVVTETPEEIISLINNGIRGSIENYAPVRVHR